MRFATFFKDDFSRNYQVVFECFNKLNVMFVYCDGKQIYTKEYDASTTFSQVRDDIYNLFGNSAYEQHMTYVGSSDEIQSEDEDHSNIKYPIVRYCSGTKKATVMLLNDANVNPSEVLDAIYNSESYYMNICSSYYPNMRDYLHLRDKFPIKHLHMLCHHSDDLIRFIVVSRYKHNDISTEIVYNTRTKAVFTELNRLNKDSEIDYYKQERED